VAAAGADMVDEMTRVFPSLPFLVSTSSFAEVAPRTRRTVDSLTPSCAAIASIERAEVSATITVPERLAAALEVEPAELLAPAARTPTTDAAKPVAARRR